MFKPYKLYFHLHQDFIKLYLQNRNVLINVFPQKHICVHSWHTLFALYVFDLFVNALRVFDCIWLFIVMFSKRVDYPECCCNLCDGYSTNN